MIKSGIAIWWICDFAEGFETQMNCTPAWGQSKNLDPPLMTLITILCIYEYIFCLVYFCFGKQPFKEITNSLWSINICMYMYFTFSSLSWYNRPNVYPQEGLNSVDYTASPVMLEPLYTFIKVRLKGLWFYFVCCDNFCNIILVDLHIKKRDK